MIKYKYNAERKHLYYTANKERILKLAKEWRARNHDRLKYEAKERNLKFKYGLSVVLRDQMLEEQKGVCAICGNAPKIKRLHVDHDHVTNKVRALLCTPCNVALGILENAKMRPLWDAYLSKFKFGVEDNED